MRGLYHIHLRKRGAPGLEPYPAEHWYLRGLDHIVLAAGILSPLMTLPQIVKIYAEQSAEGVSILTWSAYALFNIPWIIYGLAHRARPIIVTQILWIVMNLVVVIGALMYGTS